jgi:hypothetical protein
MDEASLCVADAGALRFVHFNLFINHKPLFPSISLKNVVTPSQ